jgi:predicted phosphate transport protein (TIGR00153 family)
VLQEPLIVLVNRCVDACNLTATIIEELDELLAVGFQGEEASRVSEMVETLSNIESETDELGRDLARLLFDHEAEMRPVAVVMSYQLIQWIGDIADHAEDVGDRIRLLVAR